MSHQQNASLGKRLLAITYDLLIIFFLTFIITLLVQQTIIQLQLVPLEQVQINPEGDSVPIIPASSPVTHFLRSLGIFVSFFYLVHYWKKSGQTPGMRVWKVKAVDSINNTALGWQQASLRYIFAAFGLGLLWIPFNKERLALQDILSKTRLIKVP